jgi:tetratricopeptide (TPR) repeat protein
MSVRLPTDVSHSGALIDVLQLRVLALEEKRDAVGLARAHMELAIASETILGDDERAVGHAEAALKADPGSAAAHALLRRMRHGRSALPEMLVHVDHELSAASTEAHKVELFALRARLLAALGNRSAEVVKTWEQTLSLAPHHPAALKGLESDLAARAASAGAKADDCEGLASHLVRMAEAYESEAGLAAWLHVERAQILERLGGARVDAARDALERAVKLDPSVGPVRDALVRHVSSQSDWSSLVRLLDEEAAVEPNPTRAARLELDAAIIAVTRLEDRRRASDLLQRAAARAPTVPSVDRRVLDELVRHAEHDALWADAARARKARLELVKEPAVIAYELRALAAAAEEQGDLDDAVGYVNRALAIDPSDRMLIEALDRLLSVGGKHEQRLATWLQEAARTEDAPLRARAFQRAAHICSELGRSADAVRHLRAAWVVSPGDADILDALALQLSPVLTEGSTAQSRSLVEIYTQAADETEDAGRKTAYLEKAAMLWEEILGDPTRAARAYERVLSIDPDRIGAILGLQRSAARTADARTLARALLEEARVTPAGATALGLHVRAADHLASVDPARARQLVRDVLKRDPSHPAGRALETRLEEDAGRWDLAAKSLVARIELAPTARDKVALQLALAQVQHTRLHAPLDALATLEKARALDPTHPIPPQEIARILEDHGDFRAQRTALERLAANAQTPEERARHLVRAAEIDELCTGDDAGAMRTYRRALDESPDDELIASRLARVATRRTRRGHRGDLTELAALLTKRMERAGSPEAERQVAFDLASLLVEIGQEPARAASLLEGILAAQPDHVAALRTLEAVRRRAGESPPALARALTAQGDGLKDQRARLGALWDLVALEEWKLPSADPAATYGRILELDPTDPTALEALLRRELSKARQGDPRARKSVFASLRALVAFASDDDTRLALQLRLAMMLEAGAADTLDSQVAGELLREALDRYRDALGIDELSVAAATGLARLAGRLDNAEAAVAAATSLAELAVDARSRARHLVEAAELLLGPHGTERLGPLAERRTRAARCLERALQADPDSMAAAGRLATVLLEDGQGERLVTAFRDALGAARATEAVVMLGSEVARVARSELSDLTVAIDAMRRVRVVAPQHVSSLLTLAELCMEARVWPEAVDALEAVVSTSREIPPKLTAFYALAGIYEKVLQKPEEVERVLRATLAVDPNNVKALRGLLRRIAAEAASDDEAKARVRREETADLLGRLAGAETDPEKKSALLLELADVQVRMRDGKAAERTLIEAVVMSPSGVRALARLSGLFHRAGKSDAPGLARALNAVIDVGEKVGRVDARWYVALGHVELTELPRSADGIAHLERAVSIDPTLHETSFELATAYAQTGAHEDAARVLLGMITPSAAPLLAISDPSVGLSLLEQALSATKRSDEAIVVSELRVLAGNIDDSRRAWLAARRMPPSEAANSTLDRPTLVTSVLPSDGRHILLEVAAAISGIEGKVLRVDLAAAGVSARGRISPRSGHPTRALLDRVARQFGVEGVELVVAQTAPKWRILAQETPWIVVPQAFVAQTETVQIAGLARAVARIAYGVPWLEELLPKQIEALLTAAARQVAKGYGSGDADIIAGYETAIAKALSRRQRKVLEELAPHIAAPRSPPLVVDAFIQALARAELRAAFLITGDLLATLEEMRLVHPELHSALEMQGTGALAAVLAHPLAQDLVRFALAPEATSLRRRLGTTWTRS